MSVVAFSGLQPIVLDVLPQNGANRGKQPAPAPANGASSRAQAYSRLPYVMPVWQSQPIQNDNPQQNSTLKRPVPQPAETAGARSKSTPSALVRLPAGQRTRGTVDNELDGASGAASYGPNPLGNTSSAAGNSFVLYG